MRRYTKIAWPLLVLAALLAASPASAGKPLPACRDFFAKMQTTCPGKPPMLEVGWVEGTVSGGMSLFYDDTEPPIDPLVSKPNLLLTDRLGSVRMWVYSDSIPTKGGWWRVFKVMRAEGTGAYAGSIFDVYMYGYYANGAGGTYEMEGQLCNGRNPQVK